MCNLELVASGCIRYLSNIECKDEASNASSMLNVLTTS